MPTMKDLIYAKYLQSWYKHKIIQKMWIKLYFIPVFALKTIKAEIETELNIEKDPEFQWLFKLLISHGMTDPVIAIFENEYKIRSKGGIALISAIKQ